MRNRPKGKTQEVMLQYLMIENTLLLSPRPVVHIAHNCPSMDVFCGTSVYRNTTRIPSLLII